MSSRNAESLFVVLLLAAALAYFGFKRLDEDFLACTKAGYTNAFCYEALW